MNKNQVLVADQFDPDTVFLKPSVKGWELYGLPCEGEWCFSLLMGTNRSKTYEEVAENDLLVSGMSNLRALIDRLPAGESIVLLDDSRLVDESGTTYFLESPPDAIVEEIALYCQKAGLTFYD